MYYGYEVQIGDIIKCENELNMCLYNIVCNVDEDNIYVIKVNKNKTITYSKKVFIGNKIYYANISKIYVFPRELKYYFNDFTITSEKLKELLIIIKNNPNRYSMGEIIIYNEKKYIFLGLVNNKYLVVEKDNSLEFPLVTEIPIANYEIIGVIDSIRLNEIYKKIMMNYEFPKEICKVLNIFYKKSL